MKPVGVDSHTHAQELRERFEQFRAAHAARPPTRLAMTIAARRR
jgi:hypothetical protein